MKSLVCFFLGTVQTFARKKTKSRRQRIADWHLPPLQRQQRPPEFLFVFSI